MRVNIGSFVISFGESTTSVTFTAVDRKKVQAENELANTDQDGEFRAGRGGGGEIGKGYGLICSFTR